MPTTMKRRLSKPLEALRDAATLYKVADTVLAGESWRYFWEKYSTDVGRNFEVVSHM
jgi:hypothetical protein